MVDEQAATNHAARPVRSLRSGVPDPMSKRAKYCRFRDTNNRVCRRPRKHPMHHEHDRQCKVAKDLHHDFLEPWRAYGRFVGDPLVRTSIIVRQSMIDYFKRVYEPGGFSIRIREMIADEMGVPESKRRHYVGEQTQARSASGAYVLSKPWEKMYDDTVRDDPHNEMELSQEDCERVIEVYDEAMAAIHGDDNEEPVV
jgi:hypothetical protein